MSISAAQQKDVLALVSLMDSAYRGEGAKQGWTSETDLFIGTKRTDEETVTKLIKKPGSVFLKYTNEDGIIEGCVYLHNKDSKLYLGMFSVAPSAQGKGIGKKILHAADKYAKEQRCSLIHMTVITVRQDLIAWYEKNGYKRTERILPFPVDEKFGIPTQPLEMIVLEKQV